MPNQVVWITASAGTGKTTALINRYKTLLQTCKPEQIVGITFTINAAQEIKDRINHTIGLEIKDSLLRIQTIHSLCHQILSAQAGKDISILDPNEKTILIDQALRMALNEPTDLTRKLADRFSFYHLQNLMEKISAHLSDRESNIDKKRDFDFTDVSPIFEPIEPRPEILAAFEHHLLEESLQTNYTDVFLTKTGEVRKRILDAATAKKFPDLVLIMQDEAHRIYALIQERNAQEWLYDNNLMHQLSHRVWEYYKNLKQDRLDYDELISATQSLLEDDGIRYDICRSIHHVLLDEAQDTNPKQWRIIELLTQHLFDDPTTNKSFFVVGDHKQAIYGFQNASPEFMEQQKQKYKSTAGEGFVEEALDTNYRSVQDVCNFVETRCLSPNVKVARKEAGFALEVTDFDETLARFLEDPPFLPSQNRTLELRDIMILCRKRDKTYQGIIERYGEKVRFEQTQLLSELSDIQTLMYRALLLAEPDNAYAGYKLASVIPAKAGSHLLHSNTDENRFPENDQHQPENKSMDPRSTTPSSRLVEDDTTLLELITATLAHNPQLLDTVLSFVAQHNITTPKSLYWWLRAYPYSLKTTSTDDSNTMRLLTMHGAKGLQAPVVFVFNDWNPYYQQDIWWNYDSMDFVIPPTKSVHHPTLTKIREQNLARQTAEDARLRYVAFTRAMDVLAVMN